MAESVTGREVIFLKGGGGESDHKILMEIFSESFVIPQEVVFYSQMGALRLFNLNTHWLVVPNNLKKSISIVTELEGRLPEY